MKSLPALVRWAGFLGRTLILSAVAVGGGWLLVEAGQALSRPINEYSLGELGRAALGAIMLPTGLLRVFRSVEDDEAVRLWALGFALVLAAGFYALVVTLVALFRTL
ncbi:hypothetical protein A3C96_02845 [Candidatus Uhrbacteria bacterium RIFCSPHIGHO2_02_FULL_60_10]|uniref:Uncharacterized protein n=1 Tax=Candidatus Uhrbacteria bacterium RIFCSPHIGHO2_02_FULL_60_10 TaxID=1802392 RepID=A0A1F7U275_9BACT|nr:MAG: hypothetical protein A3C96_02845 [Candidatus Uhrbacteria bacterium RIFCSPHIGHO2_02_FULL_60_10]